VAAATLASTPPTAEHAREMLAALWSAPFPAYLSDAQFRVLDANDAYVAYTGLPREALVGRDVVELQLPEYHAEDDGMVGLGVGARSYTKEVHYAHDWAVEPRAVRSIIDDYLARPAESFGAARSGFVLNVEEQQRRWVVLTLFGDGVSGAAFSKRFGVALREALPWLATLVDEGLATWADGWLRLTPRGLERSDTLGPWLFSEDVEARMRAWEAK